MKARSVKLIEAHRAPADALCSIAWGGGGSHLVTASATEPTVLVHELPHQPGKQPRAVRHHRDGVTCLALSPDSTSLASGSLDHSVKLQSFPGGEFQSNITRFTLPIRALAFNKSGSLLAAAGDDDGIKLIATADGSISRMLKGHKGPVTCLAFDPNNHFLASVDGTGTVMYWELSSGKPEHTLNNVAPNCISDATVSNVLSWSPDGETLAVSGLRNDVVMYDRDTAEKLFTLKGEHERSVCFMSWSPNGNYMATSSLDMQILIWDVDRRHDIGRQKFDKRICSLAWKPNGNALAVIDVMGRFGVWEAPVPTSMKSPIDGAPSTKERKADILFDEDGPETNASGSLGGTGEDSYGDSAPIKRKRMHKQRVIDNQLDDGSEEEDDLHRQIESHKRHRKHDQRGTGKGESNSSSKIHTSNIQEAFQPGSTPPEAGKRHFLCYNMVGSITTIENEGHSHVEVEFHDTSRGPRVPSMADHFGFTMAALTETGGVFANPAKGEKTSTLMYRPFTSWANNSEWSMRFESEEVKAVALGNGWVAAITNHNFVRIFSEGGLQWHVFSLSGPVLTAVGNKDELAIVHYASNYLSSGDQVLEVKVLNVSSATLSFSVHLSLTPGSSLSWLGFSEDGVLSLYDSKGVLRAYKTQFGGCWVPFFSADKVQRSEDDNYWVVGLNASKLFCVVCKSPDLYPQVTPKPFMTMLDLSIPLASSDLGANNLENELMMINLQISELQEKIGGLIAAEQDSTLFDDEVFDLEAARDRCILRLIANCCNGDKLVRAAELARRLSLEKSIKGAIKLVTVLKLPILAERFSGILEERLSAEKLRALPVKSVDSNQAGGRHKVELQELSQDVATRSTSVSIPEKTNPVLVGKQEKEGSVNNLGKRKQEAILRSVKEKKASPPSEKQHEAKEIDKLGEKKSEISKDVKQIHEKKIEKDTLNLVAEDKREVTNEQPPRPSNPFAKLSKNNEKPSFLDSFKKAKSNSNEKKESKMK